MTRLTKTSRAVKLLRSKFETGEVTGREDPKEFWQSEVVFQEHKLTNFRTCYNNIRKDFEGQHGKLLFCLSQIFTFIFAQTV